MKAIQRGVCLLLSLLLLLTLLPAALAAESGEPDFVRYGLDANLREIGGTYSCRMAGYTGKKADRKHSAKAELSTAWAFFCPKGVTFDPEALPENVYDPMQEHPEGLPYKVWKMSEKQMKWVRKIEKLAGEGYEWRGIAFELNFTSYKHGWYYGTCQEDWYDIIGHDENDEVLYDQGGKDTWRTVQKWVTQYQGEEQTYYSYYYSKSNHEDRVRIYFLFYVPKGYDGCVVGTYDTRQNWKDGKYVFDVQNEYMHLFRLK